VRRRAPRWGVVAADATPVPAQQSPKPDAPYSLPEIKKPEDAHKALATFIRAETELERKGEVQRVLTSFKLNPFDVLNLHVDATTKEIEKHFRTLSLLVHPDKFEPEYRETAEKAFSILNSAKNELMDENKRGQLTDMATEARQKLITEHEKAWKRKWKEEVKVAKAKDPNAEIELKDAPDITLEHDFPMKVRDQLKELLIDREWRTRQLLKEAAKAEGLAAQEKEEKQRVREEKEKTEKDWEDGRERRVHNWRDFMGAKKGKRKLLRPPKILEEDPERTFIKRLKGRQPTGAKPAAYGQDEEKDRERF